MTMDGVFRLGAIELAEAYGRNALSPIEVVDAYLARIDELDPTCHSFVEVYADEARLAAWEADRLIRSGRATGPFCGVPFGLKDVIEMEGRLTQAGSRAYAWHISGQTADVAKDLVSAGLILLGKLHTVEFAFGGWGTNPSMGAPRNPWGTDSHYVAGGSSSGCGVAISSCLVPWGVGTDTGGSVRTPAAFCGLSALKTTKGLLSAQGVIPLCPSLDTVGPMARSVQEVAALFDLMLDSKSGLEGPVRKELNRRLESRLQGVSIGVIAPQSLPRIDDDQMAAFEDSISRLASLGARVREVQAPRPIASYAEPTATIMAAEAYALHGHLAERADPQVDPAVRGRIMAGNVPASIYISQIWEREKMALEMLAAMEGLDVLVSPTTVGPACRLDEVDEAVTATALTRWVNLLGFCAVAVPNGLSRNGLPLSLHIAARGREEISALHVGAALQTATDWHRSFAPAPSKREVSRGHMSKNDRP